MTELLRGFQAACDGTGTADLSRERERLRITGDGRVDSLHGQCTNDIERLALEQSCCAAFLTAKGKMRGEGYIVHLADAFLLEVSLGQAATLGRFVIGRTATIEDLNL